MMAAQVTREETINQQYQIYLQKKAEKQAEEIEAKRLQEEQKAQAQASIKKHIKIVTVRKARHCSNCNTVIQKGEKATVSGGIALVEWKKGFYGDTLGHYTIYSCQKCKPIMEA
jgi:hypothetical protein